MVLYNHRHFVKLFRFQQRWIRPPAKQVVFRSFAQGAFEASQWIITVQKGTPAGDGSRRNQRCLSGHIAAEDSTSFCSGNRSFVTRGIGKAGAQAARADRIDDHACSKCGISYALEPYLSIGVISIILKAVGDEDCELATLHSRC